MNTDNNNFIPTQKILWFKEDMQDRSFNSNGDTDDIYER